MVKVASSRGGFVNVEITGIGETLRFLRKKGKDVKTAADVGTLQAADFVKQEVQESIIGNRAEPKSVDTGRFGNSITVDKIGEAEFKIFPKKVLYPNGQNTQQVALFLEYGTSRINPRLHFTNTKNRTKPKVKDIIQKEINRKV